MLRGAGDAGSPRGPGADRSSTARCPPGSSHLGCLGRLCRIAPDTALKRTVIEDDNVRIEETRLRGLPQRITVRNKSTGGSSYEILVGPNGKDPSQDKGTAGQSAWSLFNF